MLVKLITVHRERGGQYQVDEQELRDHPRLARQELEVVDRECRQKLELI
jgi:hypothetical protein